jgi:hypothetical protein
MKFIQWMLLIVGVALLSFYGGFSVSAHTGTEPGYFDAVEAAGYGGGGDEKIEGVSDELSNYYNSLMEEDE